MTLRVMISATGVSSTALALFVQGSHDVALRDDANDSWICITYRGPCRSKSTSPQRKQRNNRIGARPADTFLGKLRTGE